MSTEPGVQREPVGSRTQHIWAALAAIASVVVAGIAVFSVFIGPESDGERHPRSKDSASTAVPAGPNSADAVTAPPATTASVGSPGVALGRDVQPRNEDACRNPRSGTGAAWQLGPLSIGGRLFELAYSCNAFSGSTGGLEFVLGRAYRELSVTVGFADSRGSSGHIVKFEIIGDDREHLAGPITLEFGSAEELKVDVRGVTRLRLKITEMSPSGGSGSPSTPAFAQLTLVPS